MSQIWRTFKCSGTANLAWYRRTNDLVSLFDPKVHLFENSLLKILAQLQWNIIGKMKQGEAKMSASTFRHPQQFLVSRANHRIVNYLPGSSGFFKDKFEYSWQIKQQARFESLLITNSLYKHSSYMYIVQTVYMYGQWPTCPRMYESTLLHRCMYQTRP